MSCSDCQPADAAETVDFERMSELDGAEAFVSGATALENRFTPGGALHAAWLRGFMEAKGRTELLWLHSKDAPVRHGR